MRNHLHRPFSIAAALFLVAAVSFPTLTHADQVGLTIQPVKISQTLKPGQSVSGTILLTNSSDQAVDVTVSVQDFVPNAGEDSLSFVGRAPGVTSVRDWITIGSSTFSGSGATSTQSHATSTFAFAQGQSLEVPYTITAPADGEPGGHFGVVFFKATKPGSSDQLKVGTQVGMLVLVNIPGNHLEKGNILSFTAPQFIQTGPVNFDMKFQNTGTVYYQPTGTITITNMLGQKVADVPINGEVVLPTSVKDMSFAWSTTGLLLGRYTATASIVDGTGAVITTQAIHFWAFPIWYGVAFLIALIVIFFILRFLKRHIHVSLDMNDTPHSAPPLQQAPTQPNQPTNSNDSIH